MDTVRGRSDRSRLLPVIQAAFVLALLAGAAGAEQPLDGMVFAGEFGDKDKRADRADTLYFADGMFWSENCVPCGFAPAPYWVRRTSEGVWFRGTLSSSARGTFTYLGLYDGRGLTVDIHWTRKRWYRTIDRDFWFRGRRVSAALADSPDKVGALAASAAKRPPKGLDCSP